MDRPRCQLLAGSRLPSDQDRGVGLRNHIDLLEHLLKRRALADDLAERQPLLDLFVQVSVVQLQAFPQLVELLERARVRDRDGGLIGKRPEPGERPVIQGVARQSRQHTQHLVARNEGMRGDTADALAIDPLGSLEVQALRSDVLDQRGFSRGANHSDNERVQGEAAEPAVEARPVLSR